MRKGRVLTDAEIAQMHVQLGDVTTPPPADRPWWSVHNIHATIEALQNRVAHLEQAIDHCTGSCHLARGVAAKRRPCCRTGCAAPGAEQSGDGVRWYCQRHWQEAINEGNPSTGSR